MLMLMRSVRLLVISRRNGRKMVQISMWIVVNMIWLRIYPRRRRMCSRMRRCGSRRQRTSRRRARNRIWNIRPRIPITSISTSRPIPIRLRIRRIQMTLLAVIVPSSPPVIMIILVIALLDSAVVVVAFPAHIHWNRNAWFSFFIPKGIPSLII